MTTVARPAAVEPYFGPTTVVDPGRRRQLRVVAVIALLAALGATVFVVRYLGDDSRREYLSSNGWPARGQGAYQLGGQTPRASAGQTAVPIASLAKVMTALVVLAENPLRDGEDGPDLLVTQADVRDTERRRAQDQSLVAVAAGERLTERQALMAVLLPSANNVAAMITRYSSDTVDDFVERMNATARRLGMTHTVYTDPSGYDDHTVSTADDQLVLARAAADVPELAHMMATRSYRIPVAGTITNTDVLLGHDGFVGMKTGSDDAAGGCFMFRTRRVVGGATVYLIGVVLGQPGHNLILSGQYAARQLADSLAPPARA